MQSYFEAPKPKLIYVFRILDQAHKGCLKVGETTLDIGDDESVNPFTILPNSRILNKTARRRIDQYTQTAGIAYELLYTECTLHMKGMKIGWFQDKDVHEVLRRSGISRKEFGTTGKQGREWFVTDLETVRKAIAAVKEGRESLAPGEVSFHRSPIEFRPEQRSAIDRTVRRFARSNRMLWNAKMRFGKTLSALQVVREMGFRRTLILTHRPVVDAGWFDDFNKIFYDLPDYAYGSRNVGSSHANLQRRFSREGIGYVFFASMQDLRGSETVGGKFDKNNDVFSTPWDFIIIDEAHEGTQTALGKAVIAELTKPSTKVLQLSGTPFNLIDDMAEDEIFTWDYTMEQRAKEEWDRNHFGDPNPYASLPRMNIYTYDLGRLLHSDEFNDEDIAFNFREFFRTDSSGAFVHETDVKGFLDLLSKEDPESMYPFANRKYRSIFRHTLWMLPGVREARAFSALLRSHPVFGNFEIVNVAGDGDEEEAHDEALHKVQKAIKDFPNGTITLSCGRLTTGVSVPQWMGVLMLSGSFNTAASAYMQTIFRVQTPYTRDGLVKEDCYVFDFAPDRTLQVLASVPRVSTKAGKTTEAQKRALGEFLNFCPVIGMEGSSMKTYDANRMMEQLKKAYVERVVRNGFEDGYLYNDELLKLDGLALEEFQKLRKIIGTTKAMARSGDIDINSQGLTQEEYAEREKIQKKPPIERTPEEKARLEALKEKQRSRDVAVSILRGISIRMPLLIYGADIADEDSQLSIANFTSLVDDQSWEEFMPRGVTKEIFNNFRKYYDDDVFAAAGKRIRAIARAADRLTVEERIQRIASIFNNFRNPDKETVLTPWRVVNMHLSDTLGGYTFFNDDFSQPLAEPRYVERHKVTDEVFAPGSRLLEINSKSGLYPLYLAYNLYRRAVKEEISSVQSLSRHLAIWDKVVAESIFVVCKTPMAKAITRRTLLGFRKGALNMWAPDDLINKIKNQPELFIKKVHNLIGNNVKINAIVGNPPYQEIQSSDKESANRAMAGAIYPLFIDAAIQIQPKYVSLITPSRWMTKTGRGISNEWVDKMVDCNHFIYIGDFPSSIDCFPNVEIKGGVNYFLYSSEYNGKCRFATICGNEKSVNICYLNESNVGFIVRDAKAQSILSKIINREGTLTETNSFMDIVAPNTLFCDCAKGILNTNWKNYSLGQTNEHTIKYYVNRKNASCGFAWIKPSDMIKGYEVLPKHKVYLVEAAGSGNDSQILGHPFYGEPNSICSQTYICIGYNKDFSKTECQNIIKYLRTKFARYLVSVKKKTQHCFAQVFQLVPLQDFSEKSDIDWTQSVADIDRQLYNKYNLSQQEVDFIEAMIKPM